jgi:glyoxylase-like metal-dependent hydrolase (beta-lactamase superfamily II)
VNEVVTLGPHVRVHLGEKSGKYPEGNQVIVSGPEARVAFDTPLVANRIGAEFDSVDAVILGHVHEDHMAGLHRVPHATVQVHEADLAAAQSWPGLARHYGYPEGVATGLKAKIEQQFHYLPRPDATAYRDGHVWALGGGVTVRAVHLPGHTRGHCALVVEPEGVAFIGDIDLTGFGPYYGDATSNLAQFRESLRRVAELPVRAWITSHHRGVITDRTAFLAALAAFAGKLEARTEKLLGMLRHGPRSLEELVRERLLYPPGFEELWIDCAETRTIEQHLEELLAQRRIALVEPGRFAAL